MAAKKRAAKRATRKTGVPRYVRPLPALVREELGAGYLAKSATDRRRVLTRAMGRPTRGKSPSRYLDVVGALTELQHWAEWEERAGDAAKVRRDITWLAKKHQRRPTRRVYRGTVKGHGYRQATKRNAKDYTAEERRKIKALQAEHGLGWLAATILYDLRTKGKRRSYGISEGGELLTRKLADRVIIGEHWYWVRPRPRLVPSPRPPVKGWKKAKKKATKKKTAKKRNAKLKRPTKRELNALVKQEAGLYQTDALAVVRVAERAKGWDVTYREVIDSLKRQKLSQYRPVKKSTASKKKAAKKRNAKTPGIFDELSPHARRVLAKIYNREWKESVIDTRAFPELRKARILKYGATVPTRIQEWALEEIEEGSLPGARVRRQPRDPYKAPELRRRGRNFAKPVRITATRPGKLGGPGYLKKPSHERRRLLEQCNAKYGYRSCLGSIQALEVWLKNSGTAGQHSKLRSDRAWLVRHYGAKRNRAPSGAASNAAIKRRFWNLKEPL